VGQVGEVVETGSPVVGDCGGERRGLGDDEVGIVRGGRRMADTAAHLVDRVLPEVPVRQWVLLLMITRKRRNLITAPANAWS